MKFAIFGAGAIGGVLGAHLAKAGHEVSLIARGDHLAAIRSNGLTLLSPEGEESRVDIAASDDPSDFGPQDHVFVTLKAPALAGAAPSFAPLLGPETTIIPAMNGMTWWFFDGFGGSHDGTRLEAVDPGGALSANIDRNRVVGCVLHIGASVPEPGVVKHAADGRFLLGEPRGGISERVTEITRAITEAGLDGIEIECIQNEVWMKLLGNFNFGPISALTGATNGQIASDPDIRALCIETMKEAIAVGDAFGLPPGMEIEARIDLGGSLGDFRTSMWQDYTKGRPMEIDAIVGSVLEMADIAGIHMPASRTVLALLRQKARLAGLYD